MHRQFEEELEEIKASVLEMAGLVEKALDAAARSLVERSSPLAQSVVDLDDAVDQHEILLDRLTTEFIARHQPMAGDLRFVVVAIKLGPELERIADNAVNIAQRTLQLNTKPMIKPMVDLPRMLAVARAMVSDSIAAYVARDALAARAIIPRDDEVDALYWQVFRELLTYMMENPAVISTAIDLILVARFAERIADQATNICEQVVYLVEGVPISHMKEPRHPSQTAGSGA